MIRIAINGYGRIGRNVLRALYEGGYREKMQIVAVNTLGNTEINAHLTRYDTVHGKFPGEVRVDGKDVVIHGDHIPISSETDPSRLPWKALDVEVVAECTGLFTTREKAALHLQAGAKKVLISAPAKEVDATIVYGVNHTVLKAKDTIVSNASCTTNCLAPLAKILHASVGITNGLMTTVHAYTNDQVLTDLYHSDMRRARSATQSMIPTKTGAASAVGLVLPELKGKLDGFAIRVPTINVSLVDLTFMPNRNTSVDEVNNALKEASKSPEWKGILTYNTELLVSVDFNHTSASCVFDATQTRIVGDKLVKVLAWYDNEWGFANRMLDVMGVMVER